MKTIIKKRRQRNSLLIGILGSGIIVAQDVHFSMYHLTPLYVNPALTGVFSGQQRALLNYRNQWGIIKAYQTFSFQGDMNFGEPQANSRYGVGLLFYNDKAGDGRFNTLSLGVSGSGILRLGENLVGSAGLQFLYNQRSIKYEGNWPDEGLGASDEKTGTEKKPYPIINLGVHLSYYMPQSTMVSNDEFGLNFGFALFNAPKPQHVPQIDEKDKLYLRFLLHGNAYIGLFQTNLVAQPQFYANIQGPYVEILPGLLLRYRLREESKYTGMFKETALTFGAQFRTNDALNFIIQAEYANFALAFGYDIVVKGIKSIVGSKGGPEIAFRFINPNPFRYGKGAGYGVRFL